MTPNVIDLASRRKPAQAIAPDVPQVPDTRFYCTACGADQFTLHPGGLVHCAACKRQMRNLFSTMTSAT